MKVESFRSSTESDRCSSKQVMVYRLERETFTFTADRMICTYDSEDPGSRLGGVSGYAKRPALTFRIVDHVARSRTLLLSASELPAPRTRTRHWAPTINSPLDWTSEHANAQYDVDCSLSRIFHSMSLAGACLSVVLAFVPPGWPPSECLCSDTTRDEQ